MKKSKSFVRFCVFYLSIYSIILFLIFIITNTLINKSVSQIPFRLDNIFDYQKYLVQDEFEKIPINKMGTNEFFVFDDKGNTIFKSNKDSKIVFNFDNINLISDYEDMSYYLVQTIKENNKDFYIITKNWQDYENNINNIKDYCIIDTKYNVVYGNLLGDIKQLTAEQFNLLKDGMSGDSYVSKYEYKNDHGEDRTIVFFERIIDTKDYIKITRKEISKWIFVLPFIFIAGALIVFAFYRKIKDSIKNMNNDIINFNNDNYISSNIPIEFKDVCDNTKKLLKTIELEKKKREEEENVRQSIITNLSHDIKTPLTVISGYAKAFCDGLVPKENVNKYMNAIYEKALHSKEIIDSLFEYSKMEHVEFKPNLSKLDIIEFSRNYLANKYTDLNMQNYILDINIPDKSFNCLFDPVLFRRLFDNLINNSVKHNSKNTTIYFECFIEDEDIIFKISDNGKGVIGSRVGDLFKPFVVGNESRSGDSGTGLGLYICKKIVTLHNGQIKIEKKPKKPYKFQVTITFKKFKH